MSTADCHLTTRGQDGANWSGVTLQLAIANRSSRFGFSNKKHVQYGHIFTL